MSSSIFSRGPALRLTLSDPEVTLSSDGTVEPLAAATLGSADFAERMQEIACLARRARGRLTVVLPEGEVWRGALPLAGASAVQRRADARRRIAAEHGMEPDAVRVVLGPADAEGRTPVAAVHTETLRQTRAFLAQWGLVPGAMIGAGDFPAFAAAPGLPGGGGPAGTAWRRLQRTGAALPRASRLAAGAGAAAVLAALGWAILSDSEPEPPAAVPAVLETASVEPPREETPAGAAEETVAAEPVAKTVPLATAAGPTAEGPETQAARSPRTPAREAPDGAPAAPAEAGTLAGPGPEPQPPRLPAEPRLAARNLPDQPPPAPAVEAAPEARLAVAVVPQAPTQAAQSGTPAAADRPLPRQAVAEVPAPGAAPEAAERPRARPEERAILADAISQAVATARAETEVRNGPSSVVTLSPEPRRGTVLQLAPAPPAAAPQPARTAAAPVRQVAPSPGGESVAPARGDFLLIGIFGTSSTRHALVKLPNDGIERVRQGDTVRGWRVAAVGEDSVRLVGGGRDLLLELPD